MHDLVHPKIIEKCKNKDERAFKELYVACISYVDKIVRDHTNNPSHRKDLIQEIFARVFLKLNTYDKNKGAFKFWLRQLTLNQCRQFFRDQHKQISYESLDNLSTGAYGKEEIDLSQFDPSLVETYLSQMPDGYKSVVKLVILEGYSHDEVAKKLCISPATSRSQLTRAKAWLRKFSLTHSLVYHGNH